MKQHIFCEFEEKASERLEKMYSVYDLNPKAVLQLIDKSVANCRECLKIYLECNPNEKLERERICMNITPEKVYNWELLLDENIRTAYKKCMSSPLAYSGFNGVIIMIKEKITEEQLWSTLIKTNPKLGDREVEALLKGNLGEDTFVLKAIIALFEAFPVETLDDLATFLFTQYKKDLNLHRAVTNYRRMVIQCYSSLLKKIPIETSQIEFFYDDLVKNNRADLIFDVFTLFQDLIPEPYDLFAKASMFTTKMFDFLLEHIERLDFNQHLTDFSIQNLLTFLHTAKRKSYATKKAKMLILFKKLTHWVIRNSNEVSVESKSILSKASFKQFDDTAYYLLYIYLILDIPVHVSVLSNTNIKGQILRLLTTKGNRMAKSFEKSEMIAFLDEIAEFKTYPVSLENAGASISQLLSFDFSTSINFVKVFGFNQVFIENIIKNLVFHGVGLNKFIKMVSINFPDLVPSLLNRAKAQQSGDSILKKICTSLDASFDQIKEAYATESNLEITASADVFGVENSQSNQESSSLKFIDLKRKKVHTEKSIQQREIGAVDGTAVISDQKQSETNNSSANVDLPLVTGQNAEEKVDDKSKPQGNMAQRIAERANTAFSAMKTDTKPFEVYGQPTSFFEETLAPFTPILKPSSAEKIPISFNSYHEYISTFDPLRKNENLVGIRNSILDEYPYFECCIYNFDKVLRLKVSKFQYEMYDMLYFSDKKNLFSCSSSDQQLESMSNANSFLGIVVGVNHGYFSTSEEETHDLIEIHSSSSSYSRTIIHKKLFYKYSGNVVSNMREYTALRTIQNSKILKYLLRPSFLNDFFQQSISWDDKKLQFTKNDNSKESILIKTDLESQSVLQELLVQSHGLNSTQAEAVSKSFFSPERFFLIQGPPGTGKTVTIMSIISTFMLLPQQNKLNKSRLKIEEIDGSVSKMKILVCAPSNTAIDVIIARLAHGIKNFQGSRTEIPFIKVGASNNPEINKYTLEYILEKEAIRSKQKVRHEIVSNASIICTTLNSSVSESIHLEKFDLIIVDEACQATELSTIIPFKYNPEKVILIGDPNQLPPTVLSGQSQLQFSLFERLLSYHKPVLLNIQYRMHPEICNLSSFFFYNNEIETAEEVFSRQSVLEAETKSKLDPLNFIDVCKKRESLDLRKSFYNTGECAVCLKICEKLYKRYQKKLKIVILTPYKGQVNKLKSNPAFSKMCVEINTIDGFQGKECDVVVLSMVRQTGLGFTCDFRRINVGMTRAKKALFLVGNKNCLSKSNVWRNIIKYITDQNRYFTVKAFDAFLSNL